jgi:hypothetical protein
MATRSKSGLLLPLVIVVGLVVVFGGSKVKDIVSGLFDGGSSPVVVGSGDAAFMVAAGGESKVNSCTSVQVLTDRRCGDLKIIVMDAAKMPYITRNISLAWGSGHDYILTRSGVPRDQNYKLACGGFTKKYDDGSCDEYAFASSTQGGNGARTEEVPIREQGCQGGTIGSAYRWQGIKVGDDFLVVISNPSKVATSPYQGQDIAEDKASCGS